MKYKANFLALLLVGLILGFSVNAFAASVVTLSTNVDTNFPGSPGATGVVLTAFKAVESGGADNTITQFTVVNTGGSGVDAQLAKLSIYIDVNNNKALDFNDTLILGATTSAVVGYTPAGPVTFNPTTPVPVASGTTVAFLVVADFKTTIADNATFGAVVSALASVSGAIGPTAGQTVRPAAVTANHLRFNAAAVNDVVAGGGANTLLPGAGSGVFLEAVDDYGNVDLDINGPGNDVQLTAWHYTDGTAYAGLTATENVGGAAMTDGLGATAVDFASGQILYDVAGAATKLGILTFNGTDGDHVTLVATLQTKLLEGSISIAVTSTSAITSVSSFRGIEIYDTNHNGFIDHATIFFDGPLKNTVVPASNIPDNGTTECSLAAFGATAAYPLKTGTTPQINFDAGGVGIRNAGPLGVTVELTEKTLTAYDTGTKPQVTYSVSAGTMQSAAGVAVGNVTNDLGVEVDKARPQLMSLVTQDADADGLVEGILMTFSETVADFALKTTRVITTGDVGAGVGATFALALSTTDHQTIPAAVAINVTGKTITGKTVLLAVGETIANTGILPVLLYNENDAGGFVISDSATDAQTGAAPNAYRAVLTTEVPDTAYDLNVADGASPIVDNVSTLDSNSDGQIDGIEVTFSENMNTQASYAFTGVSFVSAVADFKSSGQTTYVPTAGAPLGTKITYTITPAAAGTYDTEAVPSFAYNPNATNSLLFDANGTELAAYGAGGRTQSNLTTDGAAPVVVSATTDDVNKDAVGGDSLVDAVGADGLVDQMTLVFSEQVRVEAGSKSVPLTDSEVMSILRQFSVKDVNGAARTITVNDAAAVGPCTISHVSTGNTSTTVTFTHLQATAGAGLVNGGDTGYKTDTAYTKAATDIIEDMNGVDLASIIAGAGPAPGLTELDGAKPFVMQVDTGEIYGPIAGGEDVGNGNGRIDRFLFYFSEDTGIVNASVAGGFTFAQPAGEYAANTYTPLGFDSDNNTAAEALTPRINKDALGATDLLDNYTTTTFKAGVAGVGVLANSGLAWLYTTPGTDNVPDTGSTPTILYNGNNQIKDVTGNFLAPITVAQATTDMAAPVIVQAVGVVSAKTIYVTFSENVTDGVNFAGLMARDPSLYFMYDNRNLGSTSNGGDVAISIPSAVSMTQTVTGNERKITILTNANFTVDDVEKDFLYLINPTVNWIVDAGGIQALYDDAGTVNGKRGAANDKSIMITINDVIKPYMISAETMDVNANGWIDYIKITLKDEDGNFPVFPGWVDAVKANTTGSPAGSDGYADVLFAATGWDVAGYTGEQWDFTFYGAQAAAPGTVSGTLFDKTLPKIIYIKVTEQSAGPNAYTGIGDTDADPAIATSAATKPSDYKGNPYTSNPEGDAIIRAAAGTNVATVTDKVGAVIMNGEFVSETEMRVRLSEQIASATFGTGDQFANNFNLFVGTNRSINWVLTVKDFAQNAGTAADNDGYIEAKWTDDGSITAGNSAKIIYSAGGAINDLATAPIVNLVGLEVAITPYTPAVPGVKTIAITAPLVAAPVTLGNYVDIAWNTTNEAAGDRVDLWASKDGGAYYIVANDLPFDGKLSWTASLGVWTFKAILSDGTSSVVSAALTGVAAAPGTPTTITATNLAASIVEGTSVDITWAALNYANSDQVQVYAMDATGWKAVGSAVAANGVKAVWVAEMGVTKIKVQLVSDMTISDETLAFAVTADAGTPADAVSKAVLNPVPQTLPAINNKNADRVYFAGKATAGINIQAKLVDAAGAWVVSAPVTANALGNFSGTIDATELDNGMVTLMAGKVVGVSVATWYSFADYLKEVTDIGAPAALAVTDVPADQGGFVDVTFTKSANDGAANTSDFYEVDYYVLQGKKSTNWYTVATFPTDGNTDTTYRAMGVWVGTEVVVGPDNFRILAHAKVGGAAKIAADAPDAMSSGYVYATGTAADEVVPGAFTAFNANGTAGAGVVVTWTAPADHGLVNAQYNIWGVDGYDVYKKSGTGDYTLAGTAVPGAVTFTDNVLNGQTVYEYMVKAIDGAQITQSAAVRAMASKGADFDGNGTVYSGDLALLAKMWNKKSTDADFVINYDLDKNGTIYSGDLALLAKDWGAASKVAKDASMPTANVSFGMSAEYNANNSLYYVSINTQDAADVEGLGITLKYDANKYEFVGNSITGLSEFNVIKADQGLINIGSAYVNSDKFSGTITLGFRARGQISEMNVEMVNAAIVVDGVELLANKASAVTLRAVPTVYALSHNFPNPFNPTTTINYSIPQAGNVSLVIFNVAGQKVKTLVNELKAPSFYKVVWDGKNDNGESVATGMYFYKLVSGNYSKIVKMTLMK